MSEAAPIETRIASIFKNEDGIVFIRMKDCGKVDEFDVTDANLVLKHLSDGKPMLKLLDTRANWHMDKMAKLRAKNQDSIATTKARAVVVSNKIKLTLFAFLKSFSKKKYPQQFFTDENEAVAWLKTLI
jgi:hypothetical protein